MMRLLALILWLLWSAPSQAAVFWDDGFESGQTGFDISVSGAFSYVTMPRVSGAQALQEWFCGPTPDTQCGTYTSRAHQASEHEWTRWYLRLSNGWQTGSITTKLLSSGPTSTQYPSYWWLMPWGTRTLAVQAQGTWNGTNWDGELLYSSYVMPTEQWVCVETHIQNNTPGVANGAIEMWADGQQIMSYAGKLFRASTLTQICPGCGFNSPNQQFESHALYIQHGLGYLWWDNLATGDQRIGCGSTPPPTEPPPPPLAPTNLIISGIDWWLQLVGWRGVLS